ncbi:hypothetical protein [Alicyclobacillus sendaiensis]|uniref:hypothetical protein n=1 Tax=Alicyclobacillus sendaiensis TaxID=192387 RepID=UPI0026F42B92|nr:hypothetical protein [Alicyclobacillus sendaiensis]
MTRKGLTPIKRAKPIRFTVEEVPHPEPERLAKVLAQFFYPIVMEELGVTSELESIRAIKEGGRMDGQTHTQP